MITIDDLKQFVNELEVNETNQLLKEILEQLTQINNKIFPYYTTYTCNKPNIKTDKVYCDDFEAKMHL